MGTLNTVTCAHERTLADNPGKALVGCLAPPPSALPPAADIPQHEKCHVWTASNIVGLKPTRGLIGATGTVPACRTLECISIFALTVADALTVLRVAAAPDDNDPYSRAGEIGEMQRPPNFRFAVPHAEQREFFGDDESRIEYEAGIDRLKAMGGVSVAIDYAPFLTTAKMLYEGPWVAERYLVVRELHAKQPEAFHPVTRKIIETGMPYSAADTFEAFHKLESLRAQTRPVWARADILYLPTTPTIYTIAEVESDPIRLNSNLGIYTNFVNFLDLSAITVPSGFRRNGTPIGAMLIAPAFSEGMLAAFAAELHARAGLPMGAVERSCPQWLSKQTL